MANIETIVGIDVSKETFDVCYVCNGKEKSEKHRNTMAGIRSYIKSLHQNSHCVMEATGVYHTKLAYMLAEAEITVSVVNPLTVKNYSRMIQCRTKTDKADAALIRSYAVLMGEELPLWKPSSEPYTFIKQKLNAIEAYAKSIQNYKNQLEAIANSKIQDKQTIKMHNKQILASERCIELLEQEIEVELNKLDKDLVDKVRTIPGVGKKVSTIVIAAAKGFHGFGNYRQLSSYFGLCPRYFESGTSVKSKNHICKMGMARVRQVLYLAALSASKYNPACINLYQRLLLKGKPKMVALIAVANKLIKQIFAIAKSREVFNYNLTA